MEQLSSNNETRPKSPMNETIVKENAQINKDMNEDHSNSIDKLLNDNPDPRPLSVLSTTQPATPIEADLKETSASDWKDVLGSLDDHEEEVEEGSEAGDGILKRKKVVIDTVEKDDDEEHSETSDELNSIYAKDTESNTITEHLLQEVPKNLGIEIKSEVLEDDGDESESRFHLKNNSVISVEDELKKCKGRLDAFGNELKLVCAELEIVTGWISQQFGVKLINKESLQFKHIYDFEEIEQISAALSLLSEVQNTQEKQHVGSSVPVSGSSTGRRRGRPSTGRRKTNDSSEVPQKIQSPPATGPHKRGRRKKTKDNEINEELNPQDFLETIYDDKDIEFQNKSRPKRATRKKVNYKEDKDIEIPEIPVATIPPKVKNDSDDETEDFNEAEDFNMQEGDSDFITEDPEIRPTKSRQKRKRAAPRKKGTESQKTAGSQGELEIDDSQSQDQDGDSDGETDNNGEEDTSKGKKKRIRKRYPKKPGVVWNSSLPKQCDECGKVLKGTSTLKLHKMMHADERPHACEICGNKFRFRRNLKVHMMALHTGERPLQCSFCGRKFYAPKDLRIHERTHTGEKPYPCTVCPKRFNVKEHLTMHMRVHTGERPYKCVICEKAFSQANSLRIHKKIHNRDKEPTPRKPRKPKNSQNNVPITNTSNNPQAPPAHGHTSSSISNNDNNDTGGSGSSMPLSLIQRPSSHLTSTNIITTASSNSSTPTPHQQHQHNQQHQHHPTTSVSTVTSATAILHQLTNASHPSQMSSSSVLTANTNSSSSTSGHSSPMPAHLNSTHLSDKQPFTIPSSNHNPVSQSSFTSAINSTSATAAAAMNFHQQAHNNIQHPQNPFMVPLNENWRIPFSGDHQIRFGGPSLSSNPRNVVNSRQGDNFGLPLNQTGGSQHSNNVTDPRFLGFYSQNQ